MRPLVFFALLGPVLGALAQPETARPITTDLITVDHGLPQGLVWSILQDRKGQMWFATKDGLDRYNGHDHDVFRHDEADTTSLSESHVRGLLEDRYGRIWVGTDSRGVNRYDPATGAFARARSRSETGVFPTVVNMLEHPNGDIWVHGFHAQVHVVPAAMVASKDSVILRRIEELYPAVDTRRLRDIEIMANGDVWVLGEQVLTIYASKADGFVPKARWSIGWPADDHAFFPELVSNEAAGVMAMIWDHDLVIFDPDACSPKDTLRIGRFQARESRLFIDPSGRLWGVVGDGSWFRIDLKDGSRTYLQPVLENGRALTFQWHTSWAMDRSGVLWAGTTGHGLVKYNTATERFHRYPLGPEGLGCTEIIAADGQGRLLLNAREFKVLAGPGRALRSTGLAEALARAGLKADWNRCASDPQGRLWFVGIDEDRPRHLHRYDPEQGTVTRMTDASTDYYINIFPGAGDAIWVTSGPSDTEEDGVIHQYDTRKQRFTGSFAFPGPVKRSTRRGISAWCTASDGMLWIGSDFGVYALQPATSHWRHFTAVEGDTTSLPADVVFSLCLDPVAPDAFIWVGTAGGGLARMNMQNGSCRRYSVRDGLPNDVVYGIQADARGDLWISTNQGLCRLDPRTGAMRGFTKKDGLADNEFNRYSAGASRDGRLFFGGMEGMTWFRPEEFAWAEAPSPTIITGLRLQGQSVNSLSRLVDGRGASDAVPMLTLPYSERIITIRFACMDFVAPERDVYRSRLSGFSDAWIMHGGTREATFTNLDPGRYVFNVQGRNGSGSWDPHGASMVIIITPPYWGTWWFRAGLVVLIVGLLVGFYRYRIAQARHVVVLRDRIARDLHDEIGSTLSSVSLYSGVAQRMSEKGGGDVGGILARISDSVTQVMESMNDIVWAVNGDNDDMAHVVQRMRGFAVRITEAAGVRLVFEVGPGVEAMVLDMQQRRDLFLLFKEAINNAVKYGQAPMVTVSIVRQHRHIVLTVRDAGVGFDPTQAAAVDRSGGNGIRNMRKRAADMDGRIDIRSAPGEGTTVQLRFDPHRRGISLESMMKAGKPPA